MLHSSRPEYFLTCNSPEEAESICDFLLAQKMVKTVELIGKAKVIFGAYSDEVAKISQAVSEFTGRNFDFVQLPNHQEAAEISLPAKIYI
jgi:hypothetical protein